MQKSKLKFKIKKSGLVFVFLTLILPSYGEAAILYFNPEQSQRNLGDIFIEEIRLNTEGEYINAIEVNISYPDEIFEIRDFTKGNSVLSLWAQEPTFENGKLSFIGGVPAGYQGYDGILGKVVFWVKPNALDRNATTSEIAHVKFDEKSRALLNDGRGSDAELKFEGAAVIILPKPSSQVTNQWEGEVTRDNISPEPFDIEISNDSTVYDGKYFIIFSTVDKQTGVDHYEVTEYFGGKVAQSKNAQSPYLLENQKLDGIIRVRAVDESGNFAIVELRQPQKIDKRKFSYQWSGIGIAVILIVAILYWLLKKSNQKHNPKT